MLSAARQGICVAVLATCLSAATGVGIEGADAGESVPGPDSPQAQPRGSGRIELPELTTGGSADSPGAVAGDHGIAATALDAYKVAQEAVAAAQPDCRLRWELLAGIGRVESVHASGYGLREDGSTAKPIRGPRLDGGQFALIRDTDGGRWDGDTTYDRAVGPMQFIPSTWARWGADGNGDGSRDPNNIYDAALGAGLYLCSGGRDLSKAADLDRAILSYNNSREYVNSVLGWMRTYQDGGAKEVPDAAPGGAGGTRGGEATGQARDERRTESRGPAAPEGRAASGKPAGPTPTVDQSSSVTPPPGGAKPQPPAPQPKPEPPAPQPQPPVVRLEAVADVRLRAEEGTLFAERPQVRAVRADGRAAQDQTVTYEIVGSADARFLSAGRRVTVPTDARGIATPPRLRAGSTLGSFTVRARVGTLPEVRFRATVVARQDAVADQLTVTPEEPLEVAVGGRLDAQSEITATGSGRPVAGTRISAAFVDEGTGEPIPEAEDAAPYFLDSRGTRVRTLLLDPTGPDGVVKLPEIHAGSRPGVYTLRLSAARGVTVDLTVTVVA